MARLLDNEHFLFHPILREQHALAVWILLNRLGLIRLSSDHYKSTIELGIQPSGFLPGLDGEEQSQKNREDDDEYAGARVLSNVCGHPGGRV